MRLWRKLARTSLLFMLWGSVLLNTEYYDAKLDMMAALLHETAHQLLFGLSLDQPVVENDVEERYRLAAPA